MTLSALFDRPLNDNQLRKNYQFYLECHPKSRQRDIANALFITEASMVDEQLGVQSLRLDDKFENLLNRLPKLGYIMTLMRNNYAVHERKGIYQNIRVSGKMGLVIADDRKIDLRLFLSQWKYAFAVREVLQSEERYSLQFFNQAGVAIQKIYMQAESKLQEYHDLIRDHINVDQKSNIEFMSSIIVNDFSKDDEVDQQQLLREWRKMTDVHQFMGLLRRHNVDRQQAFRLVGSEYAEEFSPKQMELVLEQAAERQIPIMCFVGNQGGIQIHSGVINKVKAMGPWLNILDPEFNLHLLETGIATAWLVRKPSVDGMITSLELYDEKGRQVVQFFGQRAEGRPENPYWSRLAESVLGQCDSGYHINKNNTNVA